LQEAIIKKEKEAAFRSLALKNLHQKRRIIEALTIFGKSCHQPKLWHQKKSNFQMAELGQKEIIKKKS
jgi:hypothetical protein